MGFGDEGDPMRKACSCLSLRSVAYGHGVARTSSLPKAKTKDGAWARKETGRSFLTFKDTASTRVISTTDQICDSGCFDLNNHQSYLVAIIV
jgi:hypothetical protein